MIKFRNQQESGELSGTIGAVLVFLTVFLILGISPCKVLAKEDKDLMKANYYYAHYAYNEAIPYFEKLAEKSNSAEIFEKLGDCYRVTGNLEQAISAYYRADSAGNCSNRAYLSLGQVLMRTGNYQLAEKQFLNYQAKNPEDKRTDNLINGCKMAAASKGVLQAVVRFAPFNSDGSDFAPTLWKGQLVYTSDTVIDIRKNTSKWTGNAYYSLYSIPLTGKGTYTEVISKLDGPKELNIKYHTGPCTFTANGGAMFFTRTQYNKNLLARKAAAGSDSSVALEIMIATEYDEQEHKFKTITPFQHNNRNYSVAHPAISPDGNLLVFSSDKPGGTGGKDLYLTRRSGNNTWSEPQTCGTKINTAGDEVFPFWADASTLYFSSDGHVGFGGLDIYKTHFDISTGTLTEPSVMPIPLNSSNDDISMALSVAGTSGYFSSDRPAEKKGDNIYYYLNQQAFLQLNIFDSFTKQPLADVNVNFRAEGMEADTSTDNNGHLFRNIIPETAYSIAINKTDYTLKQINITPAGKKEMDTLTRNVYLYKWEKPKRENFNPVDPRGLVLRNINVMDSPGVQGFVLDQTYEVGSFTYDYNKYDLTAAHKVFLDTLLVQLKRHGTMRIEVQSHTDCRGSAAYNKQLSNSRALSVVNYLILHGIDKDRLEYIGMGSDQPKVHCPDCSACTDEQHTLNRILEFKVLKL